MRMLHFVLAVTLVAFSSSVCSADLGSEVELILGHYESIRVALAADSGRGIEASARQIASTANRASGQAQGPDRTSLRAIQRAATALAGLNASDLEGLRRKFGELSRPLVSMMARTPELRRGRSIFRCPMVEGYGQWIQPTDTLQNPYMGQRMLACGAAGRWE